MTGPLAPRVVVAASPQIIKKPARALRHFDRSEAEWRNLTPLMTEKLPPSPSFRRKRCGVEKSPPSDGTGSITAGDLSAQSIIKAFSICPIPARSHARDGGGGGHPYRHFDRSEAEWRNLLPLMVRAALRREISRLRASWERFRSISHTDTQPRSR